MRMTYPRVPNTITLTVRGGGQKEVPRIGYAQMLALETLDRFGPNKEPPKGLITATGVLRKHVFNDMIPFGWVNVKRLAGGDVEYYLTKIGREVLRTAQVAGGVKKQKPLSKLLARQRALTAAGKARKTGANGRRKAA